MKLFDTHAHIGLIHEDQMEQLLIIQRAKRKAVTHIVSICNSLVDFETVYENLKTADGVYHAVGVSPSEVVNPGHNWEQKLINFSKYERVIAIGETGLDYYRNYGDKNSQVELFIKQLDIARSLKLPVIIHNREAGKDLLDILQTRLGEMGGIFHCYSEDWKFAQQALDLPIFFSFAGNITYKNVRHLHETIYNLPIERILIESESPFMVPSLYKGKRNKPAYLEETAKAVAHIKGLDFEETADILYQNSLRAFHLPSRCIRGIMGSINETTSLYHPVTIGNVTINGNIFLAPLAGYTDRAFRSVCISQGASFTYTEMVSAEGIARGSENTESLMIRDKRETQLGIQIFMPDFSVSLRALPRLLHYNPTIIDINCGCPVPKVVKTGAGSALMNDPDKIHKMIKTLKEFTDIPVSIKIRTGWNDSSINYKDVASAALSAHVDMITMHARTKQMAYAGNADWNALKELKQYVSYRDPRVVVFGSGDLFSPADAKKMLKTTGIDGLMFARGAIGNPFIFNNTIRMLQNKKQVEPTLEEKLSIMLTQLHTMGEYTGEHLACREMRKHATSYIKGISHGAKAKQALVQSTTYKEYESVCAELIKGNL